MTICDVFRGRISLYEILNSSLRTFFQLYLLAVKRSNSDEGKKQMESEVTEDMITGEML